MRHSNGRVKFLPARRIGVHANAPTCRTWKRTKRAIGITIFVLGATVATVLFGVLSAMVSNASVTPAAKTCAAFKAWDHARTGANLNTMMAASFAAPWKYIGEDASGLYADVRGKAAAKYVNADIKYFGEDC